MMATPPPGLEPGTG